MIRFSAVWAKPCPGGRGLISTHIWFVEEQGEEEKNAQELIDKMAQFGKTPEGLYLLDKEQAGRA